MHNNRAWTSNIAITPACAVPNHKLDMLESWARLDGVNNGRGEGGERQPSPERFFVLAVLDLQAIHQSDVLLFQ